MVANEMSHVTPVLLLSSTTFTSVYKFESANTTWTYQRFVSFHIFHMDIRHCLKLVFMLKHHLLL